MRVSKFLEVDGFLGPSRCASVTARERRLESARALRAVLKLDQLAVETGLFDQLGVGAVLGDPTRLEDDDAVRLSDRRQAVGDHEDGPAAE